MALQQEGAGTELILSDQNCVVFNQSYLGLKANFSATIAEFAAQYMTQVSFTHPTHAGSSIMATVDST